MGSISRVIQSRVPNVTFDVAHQVFQSAGVTTSEAIRFFIAKVAREKRMPVDLFGSYEPNAETLEAIREVERGEVERASTIEEMFEKLNA